MAAVNCGGCEPKPPDRCESSFSEPGTQVSGNGRLSKTSSHPEAPSGQSVDDKLKDMPMEDFEVFVKSLYEARKDKSKLKSANSEQAEIINELEHHSKGSSNPEETIQSSLNAKFTSSLQSLNHQDIVSNQNTSNNYSSSSGSCTNSNTISCTSSSCSSSNSSGAGGVGGCGNVCSCYTPGDQISSKQIPSNTIMTSNVNANLLVMENDKPYASINNNNCGLGEKINSEPPVGGGGIAIVSAQDERSHGPPNHTYSSEIDMDLDEEESNTPVQYFFTSKDNAQQMMDAADPISASSESDGLADFYPESHSHSAKHTDSGNLIDGKDEFGNRSSSIQLNDEYANMSSITGSGGIPNKNMIDMQRPNTPNNYSSTGGIKNSDNSGSSDRVSRQRHTERSVKNKRKPPKGETSVRQEELPGFVGDQDIEKLVQFVEGRTPLGKRNQREKKQQRELRSKSKDKELVKSVSMGDYILGNPPLMSLQLQNTVRLIKKPDKAVQNSACVKQDANNKKEGVFIVKDEVRQPKKEEEKTGEESSTGYTLVKKKRKPKTRSTATKESFPRGCEQARREQARSRRAGGSRRKSVGSVPGSENSASDGEDSVKSLPADCSTSEKVPKPCISSGGTPQTSYAEIVRIARDEERKKYGSPGSWIKNSPGSDGLSHEDFPMVNCVVGREGEAVTKKLDSKSDISSSSATSPPESVVLMSKRRSLSPDIGFPALVVSDSVIPSQVITQGPWSNRLKQGGGAGADRSKEIAKTTDRMNNNNTTSTPVTAAAKQVNGLATDLKDVAQNSGVGSQISNVSSGSPKKPSPLAVVKETVPKVIQAGVGAPLQKSPQQDGIKSPISKGNKEESNKATVNNSLVKKTELVHRRGSNSEHATIRKTSSQESFRQENYKSSPNAEPTKLQKGGGKDQRRKNSAEKDKEIVVVGGGDKETENTNAHIVETSRASSNKKPEKSADISSNTPPTPVISAAVIVNGDASETEKSKSLIESDILDDCRSLCSEKSYVSAEVSQMPVVFCGENFKETPTCLPTQTFAFEFGFGVHEIMESAYAHGKLCDISSDTKTEVCVEPAVANVQCPEISAKENTSAKSPEPKPVPRPAVERVERVPVVKSPVDTPQQNPNRSNPHHGHSHGSRHKHNMSYNRSYQYMGNSPNHYNPQMVPPPNQIPRNINMMSPNQCIPPPQMSRGGAAYGPPPSYTPPHLGGGVPMSMAYGSTPLLQTVQIGGRGDLNSPQGYHHHMTPPITFVPSFNVGVFKVPPGSSAPSDTVVSTQAAVANAGGSGTMITPSKSTDLNSSCMTVPSTTSAAAASSTTVNPNDFWDSPGPHPAIDIAHFFVPIPPPISTIHNAIEVEQFMDNYVKKLNELMLAGLIKFHRL